MCVRKLGFGTAGWQASELWMKLAHGQVVTLRVAERNRDTHDRSHSTLSEKKKVQQCERGRKTKDAFTHSDLLVGT